LACILSDFFQKLVTLAGPNPKILSCSASVVKIDNTTSSQVRFESKNILFKLKKTI
jgi:hypothetical protein